MPGLVGIISRKPNSAEKLTSQFDRMVRLLMHFETYECERQEGRDFIIGRIGLPYRGYRALRRDTQSGNIGAFDGFLYGWRGPARTAKPWETEPVSLFPLETGSDLEKIPPLINGSFTLCLYDAARDRFTLAVDRLGYRRLFYYQDDDIIAFAPEIKAFMGLDSFRRELDMEGVTDYFNYYFIPGRRTLYRNVNFLTPATILNINERRLQTPSRYWHYQFDESPDEPDRLAREMYEIAGDILKRQIGQAHKFVMALSGGMDSRLLAHFASQSAHDFVYYSHGWKGSDDFRTAAVAAEKLGLGDRFFHADIDPRCYARLGAWNTWISDGMIVLSTCTLVSALRHYREDPREFEFMNSLTSGNVNFSSAYGKEADISTTVPEARKIHQLRLILGRQYRDPAFYALFKPEFARLFENNFDRHIEEDFRPLEKQYPYYLQQKDIFFAENRGVRLSHHYNLNRFFYHDHQALVDDEIIDFYNRLPMKWQVERRLYKKMYADFAPEMAALEYAKTGLPITAKGISPRVIRQQKLDRWRYLLGRITLGRVNLYTPRNFMQHDQWYRQYPENMAFFKGILLDSRTDRRGFYNIPEVKIILAKQAYGSSNYMTLAGLATFELFCRYFIDGDPPPICPPLTRE